MLYSAIETLAAARGFARVYALPLRPYTAWERAAQAAGVGAGLCVDPCAAYPWARSVLLLVYPYAPYAPEERIPAYYIASNAAYQQSRALCEEISARGCQCVRAHLPARAAALCGGVGAQGKNGLLRIHPYGSRIILFTFVTDGCAPQPVVDDTPPCPPSCEACAQACPAGAIRADALPGITQKKCLRYWMEEVPYPDGVVALQQKHMGCEICMDACPFNGGLPLAQPDAATVAAFDLARLAAGDAAAARALVGKNITRGDKLTWEAGQFLQKNLFATEKSSKL